MTRQSILAGRDLILVPTHGPFLIARTGTPRHVLVGVRAGSWQVDWSAGVFWRGADPHNRTGTVTLGRFGVIRYGRVASHTGGGTR